MRKKQLILVAFLLMLYIVPVIFIASYVPSTIPAQQNMNKDFSPSGYGDPSPESITSFDETLSNDVLFYPDGHAEGIVHTADAGTYTGGGEAGTWASTLVKDASYWGGATDSEFELEFLGPDNLNGFDYSFYFMSVANVPDIEVWNFTGSAWVAEDTAIANSWCNGTLSNPDYWNSTNDIVMQVECGPAESIQWDYAEVQFYIMHLASADHWAESFADISDWTLSTGLTPTTDDDVMSWEIEPTEYDIIYTNDISFTDVENLYVEYSIKGNHTGYLHGTISLYPQDDMGGTGVHHSTEIYPAAVFTTGKYIIPASGAIESIRIRMKDADAGALVQFDYLRIGSADEMGWQHDGSTTVGISSSDGGIIATDDDLITLTADGDGSTFLIIADTTTTATAISCSYYPFFGFNITSGSGSWALEQYDGSAYATLQSSIAISAGVKRFNMLALDVYVAWWRITLTASGVLVSDWAKAYSIANFTVGQGSPTTADVLYVNDDNALVFDRATSNWMSIGYEPTLAVNTAFYSRWNITTPDIDSRGDAGYTNNFQTYVGGWEDHFDVSQGTYTLGTLTVIQLVNYGDTIISAIKFIDNRVWHDLTSAELAFDVEDWYIDGTAVIVFFVDIFTGSLDALLILLGLIMIPTSTLFLVYGGRTNMSQNKLFFFLVLFCIGWGLFIGGIAP